MVLALPPRFADCSPGQRLSLVARLQVWDHEHDAHAMVSTHENNRFLLNGLLDGTGDTYSLVNVEFRKKFPVPCLALDEFSQVFRHDCPSWDAMHEVIEMCCGFGGMHQGMAALGYRPVVAVDSNERMLKLYGNQCEATQVLGDVNDLSTLQKVWKAGKGAGTLAAGFACQPFSVLGDRRGGSDPRAACLTGILASAFLLQVQSVILECVQPAALNTFVQGELQRFLDVSGFACTQCDLQLDSIWPSRRNRAWWLLTSPLIGKIPLYALPKLQVVTKVRHIIPALQPWDASDEDDLALMESERSAFGVHNDSFHRYLLNFEACAPCALHSWGSQVVGCKCGCRTRGLSEQRLREKGLFGCIVHSCGTDTKSSVLRHVHPNEVMMMYGIDPIVDFGVDPRLSLAAAGQMASPLQAAWIFSALEMRLLELRHVPTSFHAEAQIQAFMTWILMRGRQVWPTMEEPIADSNTRALINFWSSVSHLSMPELVHPLRWPDIPKCTVTVASVLDFLIRQHHAVQGLEVPPAVSPCDDVAMTALDDDCLDDLTPWYDPPSEPAESLPSVGSQDGCVVVFQHEGSLPFELKVSEGETVQQLICAHTQLIGDFEVSKVCSPDGTAISPSHVLQVGQVVHVVCNEPTLLHQDSSQDPSAGIAPHALSPICHGGVDELTEGVPRLIPEATVSSTVEWTFPVRENCTPLIAGRFGPFDAGECETPAALLPDCDSWISAAPLLGLRDTQFLNLHAPVVQSTKHCGHCVISF